MRISVYFLSTVVAVILGPILTYLGHQLNHSLFFVAGPLILVGGIYWWLVNRLIVGLRTSLTETDKDSQFWLSRGIASIGKTPMIDGKPVLRLIGLTKDNVFEGAFLIAFFYVIVGGLSFLSYSSFNVNSGNISQLWTAGVSLLLIYSVAIFARSLFQNYVLYDERSKTLSAYDLLSERRLLNRSSRIAGLFAGIILLLVPTAFDFLVGNKASEFFIGNRGIIGYVISRASFFVIGTVAGVLITETLILMRVLANLDEDGKIVRIDPREGDPAARINAPLFAFWRASSSALGFIPLLLLTVINEQSRNTVGSNFSTYMLFLSAAFLIVVFPYALLRISSIIAKSKAEALRILKADLTPEERPEPHEYRMPSENLIAAINRVREIPYRGLVMQLAQILLSIITVVVGILTPR